MNAIWEKQTKNLSAWYDKVKANKDDCVNCNTSIKIINELLTYAMEFCDAEDVLVKCDAIAKELMEEISHG